MTPPLVDERLHDLHVVRGDRPGRQVRAHVFVKSAEVPERGAEATAVVPGVRLVAAGPAELLHHEPEELAAVELVAGPRVVDVEVTEEVVQKKRPLGDSHGASLGESLANRVGDAAARVGVDGDLGENRDTRVTAAVLDPRVGGGGGGGGGDVGVVPVHKLGRRAAAPPLLEDTLGERERAREGRGERLHRRVLRRGIHGERLRGSHRREDERAGPFPDGRGQHELLGLFIITRGLLPVLRSVVRLPGDGGRLRLRLAARAARLHHGHHATTTRACRLSLRVPGEDPSDAFLPAPTGGGCLRLRVDLLGRRAKHAAHRGGEQRRAPVLPVVRGRRIQERERDGLLEVEVEKRLQQGAPVRGDGQETFADSRRLLLLVGERGELGGAVRERLGGRERRRGRRVLGSRRREAYRGETQPQRRPQPVDAAPGQHRGAAVHRREPRGAREHTARGRHVDDGP